MTKNNKPSRQEMIEAIYEKIARKDLNFGCEIKKKNVYFTILGSKVGGNFFLLGPEFKQYLSAIEDIAKCEFIGHPVMIGDVLEATYSKARFSDFAWVWKKLRQPIEEQDDECIAFVYSLISE